MFIPVSQHKKVNESWRVRRRVDNFHFDAKASSMPFHRTAHDLKLTKPVAQPELTAILHCPPPLEMHAPLPRDPSNFIDKRIE